MIKHGFKKLTISSVFFEFVKSILKKFFCFYNLGNTLSIPYTVNFFFKNSYKQLPIYPDDPDIKIFTNFFLFFQILLKQPI